MVEPLRHRQTKGAATAMFYPTLPRHISTLPKCEILIPSSDVFRFASELGHCATRSALRVCARSGSRPCSINFSARARIAGGLRDQLPRKPWPRRSTSCTSTAIVAGAILVNAPTLGQWYLLQGPAIVISRTTGINALLVSGLSRHKDQGVEIGVTRIECPRTR
jgi:hypothetical protein